MADSQPQGPGVPDQPSPTPTGKGLLLTGARLKDGRTVDVRLRNGRIDAVSTAGSLPRAEADGPPRMDLAGYLLLPAPAEPHAHHDTALTAPARGLPPSRKPAHIQRRTTDAALLQLGHGATAVRTHVPIGGRDGLTTLQAVLAARRALRGLTELTAVAVPRLLSGIAGADTAAMVEDAVRMGATAIGGCPDLDPDPAEYTATLLDIAAEHGCAVDLHTDARDPSRLAELAGAVGGIGAAVTVGPCGGLGRMTGRTVADVADRLAAANAAVTLLPQGGCTLTDRQLPCSAPPLRVLQEAGVRVAAGSGALRDTANPVGRGDPLEAAYLLAAQGTASAAEAYEAVSTGARTALGLPAVRVEPGFPAELLAVRGETLEGALSLAYSRVVLHRGRVVARTSAVREFCDADAAGTPELPRQAQG
ncbi:hydrolase [Streptomyces sp. XM4193]|uniref:hydrolase n=1 Tax=Streptomyces sp. XM4193 TaxID=2929782 RepID=UPI001FFB5BDB|nr:hydrolase [Streptomyces sp. XM4193]MCK1795410.1 hydrolase [Streptomyces sp. XM4193]